MRNPFSLAACLAFSSWCYCAESGSDVIYEDDFSHRRNWDIKGDKRARLSARTENNCFILGTSSTGATLMKQLPRDIIVDTQLKVSTVKSSAADPNPRVPGACIFLRKTECARIWRSYVVRLWFRDAPETGVILIRTYVVDLAAGKRLAEEELFERRWVLNVDTWYDVRVAIVGNQITVWIDGEEIGTVTDRDELYPEGQIALSGFSWPSYAFFRNLRILRAH